MKPLFVLLGITALLCPVKGEEAKPDWWATQKDLTRVLFEEQTKIADLAADLIGKSPADTSEALTKVSVMMRCGMETEAIASLVELKELAPDLENYQVSSIYLEACDHLHQWEIARATAEIFADNLSELAFENRLEKYFIDSGWAVEKIDAWLAGRPSGKQNFWLKQRLRFNAKHNQADVLVAKLAEEVRGDPGDIDQAIVFLDVLVSANFSGKPEMDLSWVSEEIRPKQATQAEKMSSHLKALGMIEAAAAFYGQAIGIPLTEGEIEELGRWSQVFLTPEVIKAGFAIRTREALGECLLGLGKNDEAQKWMVAAADLREKHQMSGNLMFAGRVQAASGARTIEGRIKAEEKKSEDDPQYWRDRAHYYRGRKEPGPEEEALLKGLALAKPEVTPRQPGKAQANLPRTWLITDYGRFLIRQKRSDEAVALLRKELETVPAEAHSAEAAARMLGFDLPREISGEDPVLWAWLEGRPKWECTEERLLWRMLENTGPAVLEAQLVRAEVATRKGDLSRASILGWILNRMGLVDRSIPLLERAFEESEDAELKQRAGFTLFESYLDQGDWKNADRLFPMAAKRLTPAELTEWYSRIAVLAANAGAKADAMRIWGRVANLCPCETGRLGVLARAGLKSELLEFYAGMAEAMPSSSIPPKAQAILKNL